MSLARHTADGVGFLDYWLTGLQGLLYNRDLVTTIVNSVHELHAPSHTMTTIIARGEIF